MIFPNKPYFCTRIADDKHEQIRFPSILAADFNHLAEEIEKVNNSKAGWIHCDVMDGVFVPNISIGVPVIQAVAKVAKKPLDVHLMIIEPAKYIDQFCSVQYL